MHHLRFLALPSMHRSCSRPPGPASRTLYHVSGRDAGINVDLSYPPSFQSELSNAHCQLFFLTPHAMALSVIERKPLLCYFDPDMYRLAQTLYPGNPLGPLEDLDRCDPSRRGWTHLYTYNELI